MPQAKVASLAGTQYRRQGIVDLRLDIAVTLYRYKHRQKQSFWGLPGLAARSTTSDMARMAGALFTGIDPAGRPGAAEYLSGYQVLPIMCELSVRS